MWIYRITLTCILGALALYYLLCALEVFGIIKWTNKYQTIDPIKALIPFYYLLKN